MKPSAFAFADTYRVLNNRISFSLSELGEASLQKRLDDIGRVKTDAAREKAWSVERYSLGQRFAAEFAGGASEHRSPVRW